MLRDFHTHTIYSDGGNTPEEMVLAAIDRGLECIGFSDHSYTFFDESYCMKLEAIPEYIAEIAGLKEKYKVVDAPSPEGKDINDYLLIQRKAIKEKEDHER